MKFEVFNSQAAFLLPPLTGSLILFKVLFVA